MILIKFEKTGSAAYLPHLDVLRLFGRVFRRAGLSVRFSEGFHPHPKFRFCNPMSLGMESVAEYCAADSPDDPETFAERFNKKSVDGLRIVRAVRAGRDPNFAKILTAADYRIACFGIGQKSAELKELALAPDFTVPYPEKGIKKSAADKTLGLWVESDAVTVRLRTGASHLKADAWAREVFSRLGVETETSVVRVAQFWEQGSVLRSADELLDFGGEENG